MDVVNNMHIHITSDYEVVQTKIRFNIIKQYLAENNIHHIYYLNVYYNERGLLHKLYLNGKTNVFRN